MQKAIILIALLGSGTYGLAQNDTQYIVVEKSDKVEKEHRVVDNSFVIKFTPTQLLAGEINFGAEFRIGERSSVEIEAGPTLTEIGSGRFTSGYNGYNATYQSTGLGVFTSAAFRYYPADKYKALNRFYVSPKIRYRCFNTMYNFMNNASHRGAANQFGFIFNAGLQTWLSDQFAIDYFIGLGIGYAMNTSYQSNYYDPVGTPTVNKLVYRETNYIFNIGIKVGIGN